MTVGLSVISICHLAELEELVNMSAHFSYVI